MRLFVSAGLSPTSLDTLEGAISRLRPAAPRLKFTKRENLHFTLKFLGETPAESLPEIMHIISGEALKSEPFKISVEGVGYFGPRRCPRIIWAGLREGRAEMCALAAGLNGRLDKFLHGEREAFPHITIARLNGGTASEQLLHMLDEMNHVKFCEDVVKEIKLKKSTLTPKGPVYSDVFSFPMGRAQK
jgi:2'-5' RNA ligase